MTPEEQTFHDNWQKEFLSIRRTVLFGAIGHNPKTFKQYTPQNVTGLVQRFKQRKRILGVSSTYQTMLAAFVSVVSVLLAYIINPLMINSTLVKDNIAPEVVATLNYYMVACEVFDKEHTLISSFSYLLSGIFILFVSHMPLIAATDNKNVNIRHILLLDMVPYLFDEYYQNKDRGLQDVHLFYWALHFLCIPAMLTGIFMLLLSLLDVCVLLVEPIGFWPACWVPFILAGFMKDFIIYINKRQ